MSQLGHSLPSPPIMPDTRCPLRPVRDQFCTAGNLGSPVCRHDVASCSRRAYHRERRRHAILIALVARQSTTSRDFAQLEKARLLKKLKSARDRKRAAGEKVEGRKSIAETKPKTVELAHKLARARPKGGKRSLREISAELAAEQSRDQEARARLSMTIARSGPTNGHRRAVP